MILQIVPGVKEEEDSVGQPLLTGTADVRELPVPRGAGDGQ